MWKEGWVHFISTAFYLDSEEARGDGYEDGDGKQIAIAPVWH